MIRRRSLSTLCLVTVLALLAACGGGKAPAPPGAQPLTVQPVAEPPQQAAPAEPAAAAAPAAPAAPAGSGIASLPVENGATILQNFEPGNGTEAFDIYTWEAWQSAPALVTDKIHGGAQAIRFEAKHVGNDKGGTVGVNMMIREGDLSGFSKLSFWVFDTQGSNTIEVGIRDMNDKMKKVWTADKTQKNQWVLVTIDLAQFRGAIDMTRVKNFEFYMWNAGTYYMDDLAVVK